MNDKIYGLLLVGGESRRMGRDKALLKYANEQTQLERSAALLKTVCSQVFISLRAEQNFALPAGTQAIRDNTPEIKGPLCGIITAQSAHPEAHWLVLACDLPNLIQPTLEKLITAFRQQLPALTAYRSSHDQLPEPLCALYPAGIDQELLALSQEIGKSCPRKLLIIKQARLIDQDDPHSLDNINTAAEFQALTQAALPATASMQIKILYFAQLADLIGKTEETRQLNDPSPAALYASLQESYRLPHSFDQLQVAINHQLSAHQTALKNGDSIAFLPPMTGG